MNSLISKTRALRVSLALILLSLFLVHDALAYQVSPLHHYMNLTGKGATSSLTISNTHDFPLTVELTIERREMSAGIVQNDIPADEDFLIFPPQAIIQPGKKQRVQIRYVGESLEQSELYRLIVTQIPIKLDEGDKAKVNVSTNFISVVYVAPKDAKADLSVGTITPTSGGYAVALKNSGKYHAILPSYKWTASDGMKDKVLDAADIALDNAPFIEPGGARTLMLPHKALGDLKSLSGLKLTSGKK